MGTTRFTLNPKIKPIADELLQMTGVDSYSNLLNLLVTKYGQHLKQTWRLLPTTATGATHQIENNNQEGEPNQAQDYQQSVQPIDPVIERLSTFIEDF